MPQSALTPEEICSSFCLSRSMGLGSGVIWAAAGRTNNRTNAAFKKFNFIISPQRTRRFTKVENSTAFVFLRVLCGEKLLEALPPNQAYGVRHAASASARATAFFFHFVAFARSQKQVLFQTMLPRIELV